MWDALFAITAGDLPLTGLLMGIRAIPAWISGRHARPSRTSSARVIDSFMEGGFRALRADAPNVLVAGAALQPWRLVRGEVADVRDLAGFRAFREPGYVVAAISFELESVGDQTRLSTETRVQPIDARAARAFTPYWLTIRVGSGLIRREMLRAVARRCEMKA